MEYGKLFTVQSGDALISDWLWGYSGPIFRAATGAGTSQAYMRYSRALLCHFIPKSTGQIKLIDNQTDCQISSINNISAICNNSPFEVKDQHIGLRTPNVSILYPNNYNFVDFGFQLISLTGH